MNTKHTHPFTGLKKNAGLAHLVVTIMTAVLIVTAIGAAPAYAMDTAAPAAPASAALRSDPRANPDFMHTVRRGDTLWRLSRHYGTTVQAIMQANGLRSTRIYVGQRLVIPVDQPTPGSVYVVRRGDTLWHLALRFGTTVQAIMRANGLRSTRIYVGQRLLIPGRDPAPAPTTLAISPTSGSSGTLVRVVASGLPPYTSVYVGLGPQNSEFSPVAQGTTDAHGRFSVQVPVRGEVGMKWIFGVSAGSAHATSVPFEITGVRPAVSIWPTSGPAGTAVRVVATGFPPHTPVSVGVGPQNSQFTEAARGTTDANGSLSVHVPAQGAPGMALVFAVSAAGQGANAPDLFHITD